MEDQEKEFIKIKFHQAKDLLDEGSYDESIPIFSELINISAQCLDDEYGKVVYQGALNNRGVAQCKRARDTKNIELYRSGVADYRRALEASDDPQESFSTARINLEMGEGELKNFEADNWLDRKSFIIQG
jgi:tetratricopeptide (TPR) repeat protein